MPDFIDAHFNLGNVLRQQGKFDQSIVHCREVVRLAPDFADGYANLGAAFYDQLRFDDAREQLQHAVRLDPRSVEALANLALTLQGPGQLMRPWSVAIEPWRLTPIFRRHASLGAALQEAADFSGAEASFQRALEIDPGNGSAHFGLALCRLTMGDSARVGPSTSGAGKRTTSTRTLFPTDMERRIARGPHHSAAPRTRGRRYVAVHPLRLARQTLGGQSAAALPPTIGRIAGNLPRRRQRACNRRSDSSVRLPYSAAEPAGRVADGIGHDSGRGALYFTARRPGTPLARRTAAQRAATSRLCFARQPSSTAAIPAGRSPWNTLPGWHPSTGCNSTACNSGRARNHCIRFRQLTGSSIWPVASRRFRTPRRSCRILIWSSVATRPPSIWPVRWA